MLSLATDNRRAFELVADAVDAINRYKHSRNRDALEQALVGLRKAIRNDEHYLLAPYYTAVIEDLLDRSREAANQRLMEMSQVATVGGTLEAPARSEAAPWVSGCARRFVLSGW